MGKKKNDIKTYYIYFAPGKKTSDGLLLFNKYSRIEAENEFIAQRKVKECWGSGMAFVSKDENVVSKFRLHFIDFHYELKILNTLSK